MLEVLQSTVLKNRTDSMKTITYLESVQLYLRVREDEGIAEGTMKGYLFTLKSFYEYLVSVNKDKDITLITELDIREYLNRKYSNECIPGYNNTLTKLVVFFRSLCDREVITKDPSKFIKKKKVIKNEKKEVLSTREIKLLLGSFRLTELVELRNLLIVMIFLDTGMRINELVGLDVGNIDPLEGKIRFYAKKVRRYVDGYLTQPTLKVFTTYRKLILNNSCTGPLLVGMDFFNQAIPTKNRLSRQTVTAMLQLKGEAMGVRLNPHKFRHTFATNFIINGGDQFALKELLGHSSITSTDVYVNLAKADVQLKHNNFNILNNLGGH